MKGGILSLLCGDEEGDGHLQDDRHFFVELTRLSYFFIGFAISSFTV